MSSLPELDQEECLLPWFPASVLTPLFQDHTLFAGSLELKQSLTQQTHNSITFKTHNAPYHLLQWLVTVGTRSFMFHSRGSVNMQKCDTNKRCERHIKKFVLLTVIAASTPTDRAVARL